MLHLRVRVINILFYLEELLVTDSYIKLYESSMRERERRQGNVQTFSKPGLPNDKVKGRKCFPRNIFFWKFHLLLLTFIK